MANELTVIDTRDIVEVSECEKCGHVQAVSLESSKVNIYARHVGKIAVFQLTTGFRVQGKILAVTDEWIDTDNGAVKIEYIIHARWVSAEEAAISRASHQR
jgi:hypothetical protein